MSENDEAKVLNNGFDSPPVEDDNSSGNLGSNSPMKKGPWTSAEDEILVEFVQKHGEGNWNAVRKHTDLARCGKSCRLRWANHLRPDLKKGPFSNEEENLIINLHYKMGNKWARMAAELPGRTDNEIKNFWNTRIKRMQRASLPIYPPDVCPQFPDKKQKGDGLDSYSAADLKCTDFSQVKDFTIPNVEFKSFNPQLYSSTVDISSSNMPDLPASFVLSQGIQPSYTGVNQLNGDDSLHITQPLGFSSHYEHNYISDSSLFPAGTGMTELPSLQNQTGGWDLSLPSFSMPLIDDILIQPTRIDNGCILLPPNDDLLDEVHYTSETNTNAMHWTSDVPTLAPDSTQNMNDIEWTFDYQVSSFEYSSSSVFYDSSPVCVNSFDEQQISAGFSRNGF